MSEIPLDSSTLVVILLVIMVIAIVVVLFRRNTGKLQVKVKGPGGMEADVNASNQPPPTKPAINIKDAKVHDGGVDARDEIGQGIDMARVNVKGGIKLIVTEQPSNTPPKP